MLERRGEGGSTGPAQWFISHAWQYQFLDVVDSLADFMVREYGARSGDIIVWFDLFANSQHNTDAKPFEWWTDTFMNAIRRMGNVVMVCMPFGDPVTLTRAWCIFELYACVESGSRFEVAMTAAENDRFLTAMSTEPGVYYKMLAAVNTCRAKAFIPSDLDNILDVVRETVGFTKMDSIVLRQMEVWIVNLLQKKIEAAEAGSEAEAQWRFTFGRVLLDAGRYAEALPECQRSAELFVLLGQRERHAASLHSQAMGHVKLGDFALAKEVEQRRVAFCATAFGEAHLSTLTASADAALVSHNIDSMAIMQHDRTDVVTEMLLNLGHLDETENDNELQDSEEGKSVAAVKKCLDATVQSAFPQSTSAGATIRGVLSRGADEQATWLAALSDRQRQALGCAMVYMEALAVMSAKRSVFARCLFSSWTDELLGPHYDNDVSGGVLQMFERTSALRCLLDGAEHPLTLKAKKNVAVRMYTTDESYRQEALQRLRQCLLEEERVLGPQHPTTQETVRTLAEWEAYRPPLSIYADICLTLLFGPFLVICFWVFCFPCIVIWKLLELLFPREASTPSPGPSASMAASFEGFKFPTTKPLCYRPPWPTAAEAGGKDPSSPAGVDTAAHAPSETVQLPGDAARHRPSVFELSDVHRASTP